jgi:hypothetical protein
MLTTISPDAAAPFRAPYASSASSMSNGPGSIREERRFASTKRVASLKNAITCVSVAGQKRLQCKYASVKGLLEGERRQRMGSLAEGAHHVTKTLYRSEGRIQRWTAHGIED